MSSPQVPAFNSFWRKTASSNLIFSFEGQNCFDDDKTFFAKILEAENCQVLKLKLWHHGDFPALDGAVTFDQKVLRPFAR